MINFDFKNECYSCSICSSYCPVKAISFNDKLHPIVNMDKCINCSLCEEKCIAINKLQYRGNTCEEKGYIARSKDYLTLKESSSGGIFIELARKIISLGGYVCGCIYDENIMPVHVVTNKLDICEKMKGSKYVKSNIEACIVEIKKVINSGNIVLFSGVPCQIAALKRNIVSNNLITIGVVCHGSIERNIWKKYISEESQNKKRIINVNMRDKSKGYLNYGLKFTFQDGTQSITYRKENGYFLKCFTDGLFERTRCLKCEYKGQYIISDILLGDAWGLEKIDEKFISQEGASSVIILSKLGETLFEMIKMKVEYTETEIKNIIKTNQRIITPSPINPLQKSFIKRVNNENSNLHELCEKYSKNTFLNRIKFKVIRILEWIVTKNKVSR